LVIALAALSGSSAIHYQCNHIYSVETALQVMIMGFAYDYTVILEINAVILSMRTLRVTLQTY